MHSRRQSTRGFDKDHNPKARRQSKGDRGFETGTRTYSQRRQATIIPYRREGRPRVSIQVRNAKSIFQKSLDDCWLLRLWPIIHYRGLDIETLWDLILRLGHLVISCFGSSRRNLGPIRLQPFVNEFHLSFNKINSIKELCK